jgi:Kef-type K+ transport system membrane component KefB
LFVLAAFIVTAVVVTRSLVTRFFKLISSQTNELYQLASVAFCLLVAWISDKLGLSLELGAFVAGVMISTTEFAEHTLEQVCVLSFSLIFSVPIRTSHNWLLKLLNKQFIIVWVMC